MKVFQNGLFVAFFLVVALSGTFLVYRAVSVERLAFGMPLSQIEVRVSRKNFGFDVVSALAGSVLLVIGLCGLLLRLDKLPGSSGVHLLSKLRTERTPDGRRILTSDLVLSVRGERLTVPAGTTTDFSSIPWFGRTLVRWSRVDIAGVVHDWLYQSGSMNRAAADRIWRQVAGAGEHHANPLQAWGGWLALRIGGWWSWRRYRRLPKS